MKVQSLKEVILGNKKDLMGVAIILIMCYHIELGGIIDNIRPLHFLKELCDVGVDIFMLLSGFSLAFSFSKDSNVISFYKKRVFRLLPSYLIVFSVWYVFLWLKDGGSIGRYFWNLGFLNYFIDNDLIIWFVPVILSYYLITPLYIYALRRITAFRYMPYMIVILDLIMLYLGLDPTFTLLRLPLFLYGINLYLLDRRMTRIEFGHWSIFNTLSLVVGMAISYWCLYEESVRYAYKYIAYIPIALFIVKTYRPLKCGTVILTFLGGATLEIYLLHERIQWLLDAVQFKLLPQIPVAVMGVVAIFVCIPAAFLLRRLVQKLVK